MNYLDILLFDLALVGVGAYFIITETELGCLSTETHSRRWGWVFILEGGRALNTKTVSISVKHSLNVIFIFFPYELVMSF